MATGPLLAAVLAMLVIFVPGAGAAPSGSFSAPGADRPAPAHRAGETGCKDPSATCIPDGNYTISASNSNPAACRFAVRIDWGDGATDSFKIGPSRDVLHHYGRPGVYTIAVSGTVDAVLQPGATCTGGSGSFRVEVPSGAEPDSALTETLDLAGDFRHHRKLLNKANHKKKANRKKLKKKLKKAVEKVVRDGVVAADLKRDFQEAGIPKNGKILVPCPTRRGTPTARGCAGEVLEKAQDLWGFLSSMRKLADYPKYQRQQADEYYKTHDGRQELDLRAAQNYGQNVTYGQLTDEQKQVIASQAQVTDGAIKKLLHDARNAGKAGAELEF